MCFVSRKFVLINNAVIYWYYEYIEYSTEHDDEFYPEIYLMDKTKTKTNSNDNGIIAITLIFDAMI